MPERNNTPAQGADFSAVPGGALSTELDRARTSFTTFLSIVAVIDVLLSSSSLAALFSPYLRFSARISILVNLAWVAMSIVSGFKGRHNRTWLQVFIAMRIIQLVLYVLFMIFVGVMVLLVVLFGSFIASEAVQANDMMGNVFEGEGGEGLMEFGLVLIIIFVAVAAVVLCVQCAYFTLIGFAISRAFRLLHLMTRAVHESLEDGIEMDEQPSVYPPQDAFAQPEYDQSQYAPEYAKAPAPVGGQHAPVYPPSVNPADQPDYPMK